jgi:hypothetical protein
MEAKQLAKQIIDFNKSVADSGFEVSALMQAQLEEMADLFFNQSPWLPDTGRSLYKGWQHGYKSGVAAWRDSVNASFAQVERLWQIES